MAADHSTDRDAFGHWLSGFTDGEGCFYLGMHLHAKKFYSGPVLAFRIIIRQDDRPILEKIRAFWGVGRLYEYFARQSMHQKPLCQFMVSSAADLTRVVIPHFERYPLRAKKAADFEIWKGGVTLADGVRRRKQHGTGSRKWTPAEVEQFREIMGRLREQRRFENSSLIVPPLKVEMPNPQLPLAFMDESTC